MQHKVIFQTDRMILRELEISDSDFILRLVNDPSWIENIGERGVRSIKDAEKFISIGPQESYRSNGFGMWAMVLKDTDECIGLCGLVNRDWLSDIDIGFALLPQFTRKGYALEAAEATMEYAQKNLRIQRVTGIVNPDNQPSISLLKKLGMEATETLTTPVGDRVLFFEPRNE